MDANELNGVLEDVREFIAVLRTGERQYVETLTEAAAENKIAAKAIGHIIEQHLLKTDPAYKIGALLLIDSICQNVGEPYVSYFSTSIGKMFGEVWKNSGQTTRERMKRWVQMYQEKGVFPPEAIASIKSQIEPGGAAKQAAPAHATGRADPRRARPQASLLQSPVYVPQPPAYAQPSAHVASAPPMPAYNPAYGTPAQPMQSWHPQPSLPPPPMARPMYPPRPAPGGTPADPLQQYRDAQRNAALHGVAPYQPAFAPRPPLGATFRGVRLQVRM